MEMNWFLHFGVKEQIWLPDLPPLESLIHLAEVPTHQVRYTLCKSPVPQGIQIGCPVPCFGAAVIFMDSGFSLSCLPIPPSPLFLVSL